MFDPQRIKQNDSLKNSISENDFPIHTLESDSKKMNQDPSYNPADFSKEQIEAKKQATEKKLTEKQKTSPFLRKEVKSPVSNSQKQSETKIPIQENQAKMNSIYTPPSSKPTHQKSAPKLKEKIARIKENEPEKNKQGLKITLIAAILILIGVASAFSFYYYKSLRDNSRDTIIEDTSSSTEETIQDTENFPEDNQEIIEENEEALGGDILSLEKPNFLILEEGQGKEALIKYANEVKQLEKNSLVEFIPTNSLYEPLDWKTFSNLLSFNINKTVSEAINPEESLSLFIFNDTNGAKLGLSIPLKNDTLNEQVMQEWEISLDKDLESLFLEETYLENNETFQDNIYSNTAIRYKNFQPNGILSIDYAIKKDALLITTSKNTIFTLIDKIYTEID